MSLKRNWLRTLFLLMLAGASFGGAMNPKEIEELLHVMNETKVEFTVPDESDKGDGKRPSIEIGPVCSSASAQKQSQLRPSRKGGVGRYNVKTLAYG
jgi:hypothetical protein